MIMISTTEKTETAQPVANAAPKPTTKPNVGKRARDVASSKRRSRKKASPAKKAAKGGKKTNAPRTGSKTARILDLLKRPGGVRARELMKATGWQPHSVRGFLSGTVGTKMGLTVSSVKRENGERIYSVKS
jgi:hypothetical protein